MHAILCFFLLAALASARITDRLVRDRIAGADVLILPTDVASVVSIRGSLAAGRVFNPPDNPVLAEVMAAMLDRGTTQHDKFALQRQLDDLGATITFSSGATRLEFSIRCLREDVPAVIAILAEELRTPAFSTEELAKLKPQLLAKWKKDAEDPNQRAIQELQRTLYPIGHPNHVASLEEKTAGLEQVTPDVLRAFHHEHFGTDQMILVAVGDIDRPALTTALQATFAKWPGGIPVPSIAPAGHPDSAAEIPIQIPGKTSATIAWGTGTGLRYSDPDALALRVGTAILGSGFTGRLMHAVRDRDGLTYGIGSGVRNDDATDGDCTITGTFAPSLLSRGVASTKTELTNWLEHGVTANELTDRKAGMIGSYQVGLAKTNDLAGALLAALHRGQGPEAVDQYTEKISALTLEQVNGAMKRHLSFDRFILVKAGTLPP